MKPCQIITLTTDFGLQDSYVGILKGIMLSLTPGLQLVDLTHTIPPHDIAAAGFQLAQALPHFPPGTVHLAIVDPGVGSDRPALAIALAQAWLVGPDNGLWQAVLHQHPAQAAVQLNRPQYWRTPKPSPTFHGRDIFAPAAAYLAGGLPLDQLGDRFELDQLHTGNPGPSSLASTKRWGHIQGIDHFGNLITSIAAAALPPRPWELQLQTSDPPKTSRIEGATTYSDRPLGVPLALVGSHGWVEVAVNGSSAQAHFQAQMGDKVDLVEISEI